ncbi:hypothetical protein BDQ17DRAFT_1351535 [Cyathus striatus]|nr:hypothetical protein BDQ17DRAFT_1351535 [Cyathus striatus]
MTGIIPNTAIIWSRSIHILPMGFGGASVFAILHKFISLGTLVTLVKGKLQTKFGGYGVHAGVAFYVLRSRGRGTRASFEIGTIEVYRGTTSRGSKRNKRSNEECVGEQLHVVTVLRTDSTSRTLSIFYSQKVSSRFSLHYHAGSEVQVTFHES